MYSPEKSQVEICLLKSNLEEIENEIIVQRSAWPKFDSENEQKFRESLNAVKVSRALSVEIEKLTQENVRLVAKRMHLKMQCEEITKGLEKARDDCSNMETTSNGEKREIELLIRKYEDLLRENTARFRETRACFNEDEMKHEIEKLKQLSVEMENEVANKQAVIENLKKQLDGLAAMVPEDLLVIAGKMELTNKAESLSAKYDALQEKRKSLLERRNTSSSVVRK